MAKSRKRRIGLPQATDLAAHVPAPLLDDARAPQASLTERLISAQKHAERHGHGVISEALNAVIVGLSDAKEKAQRGKAMIAAIEVQTIALLDEVGAL